MPRRSKPDPLAQAIGARITELREEAGLTLEKLAYESELKSKGYLSDIEKGLARPTVGTLKVIADRLDLDLLDLVTFPAASERAKLVDATRRLATPMVRALLREASTQASEPRRPRKASPKKRT